MEGKYNKLSNSCSKTVTLLNSEKRKGKKKEKRKKKKKGRRKVKRWGPLLLR